ncbi:YebC/PmpR family DNA-binding transcriptional regulator [Candidatus Peregrinibacteria bacterium]|nr:YebC/PmpR family DNA-binding transcriptional regulator [Candidatus Peregrinibacteria bacterium]
MSGHSKWKQIKHKKGAADVKKGAMFSKYSRMIEIAAQKAGGDPNMNPSLKQAIDKARSDCNMPNANIERAIKKGTGELKEGNIVEEAMYEGFGPEGVAFYIQTATDNKNRTINSIKTSLEKHGGHLGSAGSIGWMFKQVGYISFSAAGQNIEEVELKAIDAGASDVKSDGETIEIYTSPAQLMQVKKNLEAVGLHATSAELTFIATNIVKITDAEKARKILNLVDILEENEDVVNVYSNFDMDASVMEQIESTAGN